jgi:CheY-like chemotaxis protein
MAYLNPILLADDDEDDRMFFENAVLEIDPNLKIVQYPDGMELMKDISSFQNAGILFLDINMPKLNGYQCLIELRKEKKYQNLPIIIFSTAASGDLINSLFDAGADAFIVKPNDFRQWKSVINETIATDWRRESKRNINEFLIGSKKI